MRFLAFDCRTGGQRAYEHGIIDIGAVVFDGGKEVASYYRWVFPDDNKSFRLGELSRAAVTLDFLVQEGHDSNEIADELCAFIDKHAIGLYAWTMEPSFAGDFVERLIRQHNPHNRLDRVVGVDALYAVVRALGDGEPNIVGTAGLLKYCGVDGQEWLAMNALARARIVAVCTEQLVGKLGASFKEVATR